MSEFVEQRSAIKFCLRNEFSVDTDICDKFHVDVFICYIVTLVFSKRIKVIFSIFTMSEFVEQRSAIKFCLRNEFSVAETFRMLQKAFGDLTMSQKNVYKWYKDFKEGRECVDDVGMSASYQEGITFKGMKLIWINT